MAVMLASLIPTDSQTAEYWAWYLQMETQTGWKMVDQMAVMLASLIRRDSQTADYWALHLQMETQTGWKIQTGWKLVERSAIEMKI